MKKSPELAVQLAHFQSGSSRSGCHVRESRRSGEQLSIESGEFNYVFDGI